MITLRSSRPVAVPVASHVLLAGESVLSPMQIMSSGQGRSSGVVKPPLLGRRPIRPGRWRPGSAVPGLGGWSGRSRARTQPPRRTGPAPATSHARGATVSAAALTHHHAGPALRADPLRPRSHSKTGAQCPRRARPGHPGHSGHPVPVIAGAPVRCSASTRARQAPLTGVAAAPVGWGWRTGPTSGRAPPRRRGPDAATAGRR
jgi:hypothetical protein